MSTSRLGRNPLQKKKASATEKILNADFTRPNQPEEGRASPNERTSSLSLIERLSRMDIRLDVQGILRHFSK